MADDSEVRVQLLLRPLLACKRDNKLRCVQEGAELAMTVACGCRPVTGAPPPAVWRYLR